MFEDHSSLLTENPAQRNYGIAVTDIDGDGVFELFVAGFDASNLVLKWAGHETGFIDMAAPALADRNRQAIGVAACDVDGDGREEIYVLNTDTFGGMKRVGDRLFDYRSGEGWVDLFEMEINLGEANLIAGRSVGAVDRTGSGRYGFFVANYGGPMRLYELDELGRLVDLAPEVGVALKTGGRGVLPLPLISQGMDIYVSNEGGANYLFLNQGDGTFVEAGQQVGLGDMYEDGRGLAAVDADDDGRLDVVLGNWEGPHRLFVRTGYDMFRDRAARDFAAPSRGRTVIAADFDNDGYEEIFFNNIGQPNRLFARRDGQWVEVPCGAAREPTGLGTGAAVGDFDGDGRLELIIAHGEFGAQPLSLYRAAAQEHNWLRVLPLPRQGAPARGALVTIRAGGRKQVRAIDAGSGYLCQMEPVAHFGLGTGRAVEEVTVRWPGGAVVSIVGPAINEQLVVPYPGQ
ncbi:MAG: CRTAC1 family protein [Chloroflexi bacterium]|nr:CRTAC1 family protein [Chloroflexota bacterium]